MAGPQCCEYPPIFGSGSGAGHVETIGGRSSYISGDSDAKTAIILISDIYGYEAPELRKIADKLADAGFYVLVPNFLHDDPYVPENAERPLLKWLMDHDPVASVEEAKSIVEALTSRGVVKVGAAGFCWGAKVVVELAKSAYIQAAVMCHPSFVTLEDIKGVKVPMSVLGAETDLRCPPELAKQFEVALDAMPEIDGLVKIFPGVSHGWTVRYKEEDEIAVKCAGEAHQDMLSWFTKYLN